jgi:hypothetical protein
MVPMISTVVMLAKSPLIKGFPGFVGQVAITIHESVTQGAHSSVEIGPSRCGSSSVGILGGFNGFDAASLRNRFLEYDQSVEIQYCFGDRVVLSYSGIGPATSLVKAGAFPGSVKRLLVDPDAAGPTSRWASLETGGLVERHGGSSFQLTQAGVACLRPISKLGEPRRVCEPRLGTPLADRTVMELVLNLETAGWKWEPLPRLKKERDNLVHERGKSKLIWYGNTNSPNAAYLRCLLKAEQLQLLGIDKIPHHVKKPTQVYSALEKGTQVCLRKLPLSGDVDGAAVDGAAAPPANDTSRDHISDSPGLGAVGHNSGSDGDMSELERELEKAVEDWQAEQENAGSDADSHATPIADPDLPLPLGLPPLQENAGSDADSHATPIADPDLPLPLGLPPLPPPADPSALSSDNEASHRKYIPGEKEQWGCFRITHLAPLPSRPFGAFEASCHFHKKKTKRRAANARWV